METVKGMNARVGARIRQRRVEQARADINAFVEYCFTDAGGVPIQQADLHRRWHEHVDKYQYAGIIAPRDHGKTLQFAIARPIWELGRNHNLRIKLVCADVIKARKRLLAIKEALDRNPRVREVFPGLVPNIEVQWNGDSLFVMRDAACVSPEPSVEARGILTSATGSRADLLICDDVCDYVNAVKNPSEREKVRQAFNEDWMNLLEPDGRAVYISTPWHHSDLTHLLLENPVWKFLRIAINDRLDPIWPEKWSRESLKARLDAIKYVAFARAYQCKITASEEESYFRVEDLEAAKDYDLRPETARRRAAAWPKYFGVDLAAGKRTKRSKYSVCFCIAIEPETRRRVPLAIIRKREPMPRFLRRVSDLAQVMRPEVVVVENNALQQAVIELAREGVCAGLPLKSLHTGKEKSDIEIGLPGLATEFENGLWCLPYGGPKHAGSCRCNLCLFVEECRNGTMGPYTDILMAAWLATRLLMRRANHGRPIEAVSRVAAQADWDPRGLADRELLHSVRGGSAPYDPGW